MAKTDPVKFHLRNYSMYLQKERTVRYSKHIRSATHDFKSNNIKGFWNHISARRKQNSTSPLEADSLAEHYASIMQYSGNLSPDQQCIADIVNENTWVMSIIIQTNMWLLMKWLG